MGGIDIRLVPPSPVTDRISVDVRASWRGEEPAVLRYILSGCSGECLLGEQLSIIGKAQRLSFQTADLSGSYRVCVEARAADGRFLGRAETPLTILPAASRSGGVIGGAWCGLYHWSEAEGRLWNSELRNFSAADWRELVRGMHRIGMDIIVLQELFRNEYYYDKHRIEQEGYSGKAFYPSQLFPGRMEIACSDPVEAILSEADRLGMAVFAGIGMYAWFDYTEASLNWHKKIAREVFERYGGHPSLYGWYISEEVFGNLEYGSVPGKSQQEIVQFFHEFSALRDELSPVMPVMLAPNCFEMNATRETWKKLARELDIICPFGFNRLPPTDLTPEEAAELFREIATQANAHLWMDMEVFEFAEDQALAPRKAEDVAAELEQFSGFEKILCYQYPGLFNAPEATRKPGGPETVKLFQDYSIYRQKQLKCPKKS